MTGQPICILVPIDGSANAARALDFALNLAKAAPGARLELVNAQPGVGGAVSAFVNKAEIKDFHRAEGMNALGAAIEAAKKAGVPYAHHIGVGEPAAVIAAFAKQLGCGQIVMGTRGLGSALGLLLGSVANEVIRQAEMPVTLVK